MVERGAVWRGVTRRDATCRVALLRHGAMQSKAARYSVVYGDNISELIGMMICDLSDTSQNYYMMTYGITRHYIYHIV